jgi:hypothetical protein
LELDRVAVAVHGFTCGASDAASSETRATVAAYYIWSEFGQRGRRDGIDWLCAVVALG